MNKLKIVIVFILLNLSFLFVPTKADASITCVDGMEYCNSWCRDNYPFLTDVIVRTFCYSGCATTYVACEFGLHPRYQ